MEDNSIQITMLHGLQLISWGRAVIQEELSTAVLPGCLVDQLHETIDARLNVNGTKVLGVDARTEGAAAHICQDEAGVDDEGREPRLFKVNTLDEPVEGRLAGAVGAQAQWQAEFLEGLLVADAAEEGRDGQEDWVAGLAGLEERPRGLEEGEGSDGVDVDVLPQELGRRVRDRAARLGDAGVGDDDVQRGDAVLALELLDSGRSIRVGGRVDLDGDEARALALGELLEG
ncbi:hypothetical protein BN1708_003156 [Verticillium longisporum]|uniref:Uncharacterized protein n=1 Tax=Verticillium longisporum TaxID=100787 RepID=A0A0G4LA18_VERLO|nr:hypothetical protein BN1708_003156 [Verticillium longisporum]